MAVTFLPNNKPPSRYRLNKIPLSTGEAAVYKYQSQYEELFTFDSRYGDKIFLYKVVGTGEHRYISLPREVCPLGVRDLRRDGKKVQFNSIFSPRNTEQKRVVHEATTLLQNGKSFLIQAPTGFGKTVVTLQMVANVGRKTAIIVTKTDLRDQWIEEAKTILQLKPSEIGIVQANSCDPIGKKFVVFMVKSISKLDRYPKEIYKDFGLVIWDECHRVCANTFSESAWLFPAKLRLGLSATPTRKDGKEVVLHAHIGKVLVKTTMANLTPSIYIAKTPWKCPTRIVIRDSVASRKPIPHSPGKTMHLNKLLMKHSGRNDLIARFLKRCWENGRNPIFFSDLKEHLTTVMATCRNYGIPSKDMGMYVGGLSKKDAEEAKNRKLVFSTYSYCSEGTNIPRLDACILGTPRSDVVQIIGRILRELEGKLNPVVLDLRDNGSLVFDAYLNSRMKFYKSIGAPITYLDTK